MNYFKYLAFLPLVANVIAQVEAATHGTSAEAAMPVSLHGHRGTITVSFEPNPVSGPQSPLSVS